MANSSHRRNVSNSRKYSFLSLHVITHQWTFSSYILGVRSKFAMSKYQILYLFLSRPISKSIIFFCIFVLSSSIFQKKISATQCMAIAMNSDQQQTLRHRMPFPAKIVDLHIDLVRTVDVSHLTMPTVMLSMCNVHIDVIVYSIFTCLPFRVSTRALVAFGIASSMRFGWWWCRSKRNTIRLPLPS